MTDHAHELRRYARKIGHPAGDVPAVMLAAADEIERLQARAEAAEKERDFAKTEIARLHGDIRELTDERVLDEEDRELWTTLKAKSAEKENAKLQRVNGKTAHQLRAEAEKERDALRVDKATLQQMLYSIKNRLEAAERSDAESIAMYRKARDERDALRADLETEQVRLAACGVVALANTPDSAKRARDMRPEYWSASCGDVARLVDENIKLRAKIEAMGRQEPVATVRINAINGNPSVDFVPGHHYLHHNDRLYLAPGAQPEPSINTASLYPVINWLRNGCDPMKAADELEMLAADQEAKP